MMQDEERVEQLDKKIIDTRINVEPKGLARETLTMKCVEVTKFDDTIEISFLEKASYYMQITWKLIKIIYPILPYLVTIWQWIESLKSKKRSN
jgi:hypothetical protein